MAVSEPGTTFASPEIALCFDKIERCIGRIVAIMVDSGELATIVPAINSANSLVAIVSHVLGNIAENLLATLSGEHFERDRDAEFTAQARVPDLLAEWETLQPRLRWVAAAIPSSALFETRPHPRRGEISVLEVFLVVLRHVGEHEGHAQLTRDWVQEQESAV